MTLCHFDNGPCPNREECHLCTMPDRQMPTIDLILGLIKKKTILSDWETSKKLEVLGRLLEKDAEKAYPNIAKAKQSKRRRRDNGVPS